MAAPFSIYQNFIVPQRQPRRDARAMQRDNTSPLDVLPPELIPQFDALSPPRTPADDKHVIEQDRYSDFVNQPLVIGTTSQLVLRRPAGKRVFLLIVNTHATQTMFVAFGVNANPTLGLPIQPLFGSFGLDTIVAQDDIYISANAAGTTGVLIYSNIGR